MSSDLRPGPGYWPTPQQLLLLRAALWQGSAALSAWSEWAKQADLDGLDLGSFRLLPLVYTNLQSLGLDHPWMSRLKGVKRRAWYANRLLFHRMRPVLDAFESAGLKTLVLKGPALATLYYPDLGARPMQDFDILVPTHQAPDALGLLSTLGFTSKPRDGEVFKPGYLSVIHGYQFTDAEGFEMDLHWHVFPDCCRPDSDDDLWAGAIPLDIEGLATRALNPADQLLHICVHGMRWNPVPPVRWAADAVLSMTRADGMDWSRLIGQATKRRFIIPLREALRYLHDALDAPVPPDVLASLFALPVTPAEQREYDLLAQPLDALGPMQRLWLHYRRYVRTQTATPILEQPGGFARFLQYSWGLDHWWEMPAYALRGGARRAWRATRSTGSSAKSG